MKAAEFTLRKSFVAFPQAEEALRHLRLTHREARVTGLGRGIAILGPSGVGKSTVLRSFANEISGADINGPMQRCVSVDVPSSPTPKSLAAAILHGLHCPFAYANKHSAEEKLGRVALLMSEVKTEVLILDEAQHLVERSRRMQLATADWLKVLMNQSRVVVVLAGLERTEEILRPSEQLRRRFSATYHYSPFDAQDRTSMRYFAALLKLCQDQLPYPSVQLYSGMLSGRFHYATFGLIDYLIKILDRAVSIVSDAGGSEITLDVLSRAFREKIWSMAPPTRNPFEDVFDMRPLIGADEPFESFDVKAAIVRAK